MIIRTIIFCLSGFISMLKKKKQKLYLINKFLQMVFKTAASLETDKAVFTSGVKDVKRSKAMRRC